MWATTRCVALEGAVGHVVEVQVDVSDGKIGTHLVGRPDISLSEARDRCRAAVENSALQWPNTKRITISLSPADVPKRGSHFDLAIALGVLAASHKDFPRFTLDSVVMIGELTVDGRVRCVPGVLPMVMAASTRGIRRVVVPEPQLHEAALVPGVEAYGVRSLAQAIAVIVGADEIPEAPPVEPLTGDPLISWRGEARAEDVDLADVRGMADARYALEVAAAGGHHLMLTGPKGAGKTTLAERIPTILPDLSREESLELTAVHSLAGSLPSGVPVLTRPPFRAPHHSASRAGILGGGTGRVRPGEVSKAHLGVLFLDEFPLLPSDVVEALRQPLESGVITIARGDEEGTYPAGGMLVLACNPCPCGDYSPNKMLACSCGPSKRRDYQRKISGPIADRIDITRWVEPASKHEMKDPLAVTEPSSVVLARVTAARERQRERYADSPWRLNGQVPGPVLSSAHPLPREAQRLIDAELYSGALTRRGATRVHRLAWTIADLRQRAVPGPDEVRTALRLRTGQPLDLAMLEPVPMRSAG